MASIVFVSDDAGYREWLEANPAGFVLNLRSARRDANYAVLHRSTCLTISSKKHVEGGYTGHGYRKACSNELEDLRDIARLEGRLDGSFSNECFVCLR